MMKAISLDRGLSSIREIHSVSPTSLLAGGSGGMELASIDEAEGSGSTRLNSIQPSASANAKLAHGKARRQKKNMRRLARSLGASLWPLMRQQIFLGMAALSVPVKMEVPQLMEDLTAAGVRFVYFSPRNMRRSKPVAEKIGITFDWNCAISLRELASDEADPHRYISNYADWDQHARLPHGVPAIKKHLREVDNVPLLVSLYTDSTPQASQQMVEVFRSYGEVVLTVGSAYRASNSGIFRAANIAVSVSMLPGYQQKLPIHSDSVLRGFPTLSSRGLSRADLMLVFRLVGLGAQQPGGGTSDLAGPELNMEALLEAVRKGRVLLLNMLQALAFLCVALLSPALWPVVACALPTPVPGHS
eukprot:GSChrysophyteH2.ASY1.ANO1.537.1 assembled CDS